MYRQTDASTRDERHPHFLPLPPLPSQAHHYILVPIRRGILAHHHLLSASAHSSLNERRVCRLPSGPLHGIWHLAGGIQVCPAHFHEDAARSYGLVHRSVLGRRAREYHAWKDPDQPFARVGCEKSAGGADCPDNHRRRLVGHNPQPNQGHPKDWMATTLHRMVLRRRTSATRVGALA